MIEKMLKTTVICRIEDRDYTLDSLRSIGVLHVEQTKKPDSPNQAAISQEIDSAKRILGILSDDYKPVKGTAFNDFSGEELTKEAMSLFEKNSELKKDIEICQRNKRMLVPWGNFSFSTIDTLREKGLFVYLCESNDKAEVDKYRDKGSVEIVTANKNRVFFALISTKEYDKNELSLASLPPEKISLKDLEEKILELNNKCKENNISLSTIASNILKIREHLDHLEEELEFSTNKNGMGSDYVLCYIKGFTPIKKQDKLTLAAKKHGWAVHLQQPSKDDQVPTLITIPKIFRLITPVFKFIGISPGYNEWDVSICFLFFFTIFFAMIVGDAGYGILFLFIAIVLKVYLRKQDKFRLILNLFVLLSIATVIWGMLTCNFFGMPQELFPRQLQGLKMLTDPDIKNSNIQYLCFLLAAMQLSFARIWKAIIMRNSFRALGQLGWAMFIWGNFFTAVKLIVFSDKPFPVFAFYLYGIGFLLIIIFYVKWTDVGSVFNLPFNFIGSFSDVLSYIRLFAVGLASYYIASSFNNMGNMVLDLSPYLIIFTIIVLLFGHLLNIALALMGVLVHGIRLNTLEFSNHMELEWTGFVYKPFKKRSGSNENNDNKSTEYEEN